MARRLYLGLDQGTTGTTAILFDEHWRLVGRGYQEIRQYYPRAGWVEHDPEEIWYSALSAVRQAMNAAGAVPRDIRCLGLDHEGESVVVWEKTTGKPVYPAIVWQDRRTAAYADSLKADYESAIREKTGLLIDPYFSATKLKWILDRVDLDRSASKNGRLLAGTMDVWLNWKLTGGKFLRTDASTASRTMLYHLQKGAWDWDILDLMGLAPCILPEIGDSAAYFGETDPEAFLDICCPITGVMVDQQAALLGQACIAPGTVKTTYGTGCFMLMNSGETPVLSESGLLTTVAWQLDGKRTYALDGGIYIAGAATQWLRDGAGIISDASQTEGMALRAGGNGGLYFVPSFTGLAAPYWDSYARGMMIGITGGTSQDHIVRATLESTAYQVKDVLDVMARDSGVPITVMRCDGGSTCNRFLMQFQADILNIPLEIPEISDTTALGAAYMAAIGVGDFSSLWEAADHWKRRCRYEPTMSADQRQSLLHHWHRAVERARNWAE
ncbi:glycerol kinase GlpK [Oscillibacter hominis]|uniref:glycerol kinase n=1 Tax=Oscillibacter hominis TaxID=2763056 RepID=A0A7G9B6V4_9FIRM|nr:glycerol kinase GlpK [Oscillibacter hominis]QNL45285.1 glycerol kinase GlpK [Oscillibacter hominis]